MKYLIDTNILRELGKTNPHGNVAAWQKTVDDAELAISALTVREVAKGVAKRAHPLSGRAMTETASRMFSGPPFGGQMPAA